jgi:hypothetical protein
MSKRLLNGSATAGIDTATDHLGVTYLATIEIEGVPSPEFLESIYELSTHRQIALLLRSASPILINTILDPVVRRYPISIPGLRYCIGMSDPEIDLFITNSQWIWGNSRRLRSLIFVRGLGARYLPLSCWDRRLFLMSLDVVRVHGVSPGHDVACR